jgi:type VI secretion system secreted protein Hcp
MATDIFLKLDSIKGESQDATHKDEIEVLAWAWDVAQESSMHSGSGGGSGKAMVRELKFSHYLDCASPNLIKFALIGKHIPQAVLVARKAGGLPHEYLKITMKDVIITRVKTVSYADPSIAIETVSLSFAEFRKEYFIQNEQGGLGGTISVGYDIKRNVEV